MSYSHELVKQYQKYMHARCGVCISDADAQIQLESLASLFLCFTDSGAKNSEQVLGA